jgi:hypothetical protein
VRIRERTVSIPAPGDSADLMEHICESLAFHLKPAEVPIRCVIVRSDEHHFDCEVAVIPDPPISVRERATHLFDFRRRKTESVRRFNAVLVVPTGIGAEIGGHAGDATAVAHLLAAGCDQLVLHPNVVNASDINELPSNSLYVEGGLLTRLLMGTIGLQPTRANRMLVILDEQHSDIHFVEAAVNSVSAARATFGLNCVEVVCLNPSVRMSGIYAGSGRAVGHVDDFDYCLEALDQLVGTYDAVALSSVIRVPHEYHVDYFRSEGKMVNPWGGVEAMLTHAITSILDIPAAHSPMFESRDVQNLEAEAGLVEPRMAAEAVSLSFLQCILKGLHKSPSVVWDKQLFSLPEIFSVEDVGCLVIPDGCLGLATLASLQQGIRVIAVRENRNLMRNDLTRLPWASGQFIQVDNYLEAAGVMNAIRAGVTLESVCRPLSATKIIHKSSRQRAITKI